MPLHATRTRGQVLFTLGVIWLLISLGIGAEDQPDGPRRLPHEHLPIAVRVALWSIPGAVAMLAVFYRRMDEAAWWLLVIPPAERCVSFGYAWIIDTYPPGWRAALVYAASAFLINRCAAGLDRIPPHDIAAATIEGLGE